MNSFFKLILYGSILIETLKSTIVLENSYGCTPSAANPTQFEMNFLTDKAFYLGCIDKIQFVDLFLPANNFEFNLPTPPPSRTLKVTAISSKKKNPPANLDIIYVAYGVYNGFTLESSKVVFMPNYLNA